MPPFPKKAQGGLKKKICEEQKEQLVQRRETTSQILV